MRGLTSQQVQGGVLEDVVTHGLHLGLKDSDTVTETVSRRVGLTSALPPLPTALRLLQPDFLLLLAGRPFSRLNVSLPYLLLLDSFLECEFSKLSELLELLV